jgi:plastocyanin
MTGQRYFNFTSHIRFFKAIAVMAVLILSTFSLMPSTAWAASNEVAIGSKRGELVFKPSTVTIKSGETVTWVNNLAADAACNVVFDALKLDESPARSGGGPTLERELFNALSHQSLITTPQQTYEKVFNVFPGVYSYSCTPHKSSGMVGRVIVQGD